MTTDRTAAGGRQRAGLDRRAARGGRAAAVAAAAMVVLLGSAALPGEAAADGRVALVIGNSAYDHADVLVNPGNDAADIGAALRRLGFDVTPVRDAGKAAMERALGDFADASAGADVALVFYAGHGLEVNGTNYLMPVDARLASDTRVRFEMVPLDDVLASTEGAGLRVVILDACRNNPLARSMRRSARTRSASRGSFAALDEELLGDETLVAYSAAAGTMALDGEGRNSPYAAALLAHLERRGLELGMMFRQVRSRVLASTDRTQRPHEYASLLGEHYLAAAGGSRGPAAVEAGLGLDRAAWRTVQRGLAGAGFGSGAADGVAGPATRAAIRAWQTARGAAPTGYLDAASLPALGVAARAPSTASTVPAETGGGSPAGGAAASASAAALQAETALWQSIESRPTLAKYEAYLSQYPNGTFAALARLEAAASRPAAAADPRPARRAGERFRDCAECPELVVVPAGSFTMGSPSSEDGRFENEGPQRRVTIPSPLAVGVYEVTRGEFGRFVSATGHATGGRCYSYEDGRWGWVDGRGWRDPGFAQTDGHHPVVCVSWEDAQAYVRWLSRETGARYRLLSESEWEYVARGGTATSRHWGEGSSSQCGYANGADRAFGARYSGGAVAACDDGVVHTARVGSYRANGFGVYDVLGNVREWVEDCWHNHYSGAPSGGSAWTSGEGCGVRMLRGGSWRHLPRGLRSANRGGLTAGVRSYNNGFRVSRTLD